MSSIQDTAMGIRAGKLGDTIPPGDTHGVSVSLPCWADVEGWAQRAPATVKMMKSGYPRFFIHPIVDKLAQCLNARFGPPGTQSILLSSAAIARQCHQWIASQVPHEEVGSYSMHLPHPGDETKERSSEWTNLHACWFHPEHFKLAKAFWQHTGQGISSRRAEHCAKFATQMQLLASPKTPLVPTSPDSVEQRGQRAQNFIASELARLFGPKHSVRQERDVKIYLSGMKAIFDTTTAILQTADPTRRAELVAFGFVYLDTFKILEKFNSNSALMQGFGSSEELDRLEARLTQGEHIRAVYTEFPTNPLLTCIDFRRLRALADKYDFIIACDDTLGPSVNVDIFDMVDVMETSLTKLFSGKSNVMGGAVILNPRSKHHAVLKAKLDEIYEDVYFPDDAILMEQNCPRFDERVKAINTNARAVADYLVTKTALIERVYYPSIGPSKEIYDSFMKPDGGYGFLLSVKFHDPRAAHAFYDNLDTAKGPSLGTNFTLTCPYTYFSHYNEQAWAAGYGVVIDLVRMSVGVEADLLDRVKVATMAAEASVNA